MSFWKIVEMFIIEPIFSMSSFIIYLNSCISFVCPQVVLNLEVLFNLIILASLFWHIIDCLSISMLVTEA